MAHISCELQPDNLARVLHNQLVCRKYTHDSDLGTCKRKQTEIREQKDNHQLASKTVDCTISKSKVISSFTKKRWLLVLSKTREPYFSIAKVKAV